MTYPSPRAKGRRGKATFVASAISLSGNRSRLTEALRTKHLGVVQLETA